MAGRRFPSRFPARRFFAHSDRSDWLELWRRDLPVRPRLALIANLDPPVFPFAHHHLGWPGRIVARPLQLKIAILIPHHPVVGNAALGLQTKTPAPNPERSALCGENPAARLPSVQNEHGDRPDTLPAETGWPPRACPSSGAPSS